MLTYIYTTLVRDDSTSGLNCINHIYETGGIVYCREEQKLFLEAYVARARCSQCDIFVIYYG